MHKTPVGGNVFADLGFDAKEANLLKAESNRVISEKLAIKESLMSELAVWMDEQHLKQSDAAQILGVTRPRVSDVMNKKTVKFTIDALVDMLARTGKHVQLSVSWTNELIESVGIKASYLVGFRSIDEIRNRLIKAKKEVDIRIRSKGIQSVFGR